MRYLRDVDVADAVLGVTIHDGWMVDLTEITMAIASIPSADVRPVVRGEWLAVDDRNDAFDCSVCDAMVSKRLNFCPHCGADMRVRSDCESKT